MQDAGRLRLGFSGLVEQGLRGIIAQDRGLEERAVAGDDAFVVRGSAVPLQDRAALAGQVHDAHAEASVVAVL